jgi:hypothetical protein
MRLAERLGLSKWQGFGTGKAGQDWIKGQLVLLSFGAQQ